MADEKKPDMIQCRLCRKDGKRKDWRGIGDVEEWSRICDECRGFWELGKKAAKAAAADGKEFDVSVPNDIPAANPKLGDPKGPTEIKGKDVVTAMGGISLRGTEAGKAFNGADKRINLVELQDREDWMYVGGGSMRFKAPKSRAEAMKRILTAMANAVAKARVAGFDEGRNLLAGLASGNVSLDQFSEQTDNSRAGKKPRKTWDS